MPNRPKVNLTLDIAAHDMLSRSSANLSAYLSNVVRQRWAEWHAALAYLLEEGWKPGQLRDACARLNGVYELRPGRHKAAVQALRDWRHQVEASDPQRLAAPLHDEAQVIFLCTLAAEYWAGNNELRQRLEVSLPPDNASPRRVRVKKSQPAQLRKVRANG